MHFIEGFGWLSLIFVAAFIIFNGDDIRETERTKLMKSLHEENETVMQNPKKWISSQIKDIQNASISGTIFIIDNKIEKIKKNAKVDDKNQEWLMECGNVIDALEREKECIKRMQSPVSCLDG